MGLIEEDTTKEVFFRQPSLWLACSLRLAKVRPYQNYQSFITKLYNQVRSLSPFRSSDLSLEIIYLGFVTLEEFLLRKSIEQYYVLW